MLFCAADDEWNHHQNTGAGREVWNSLLRTGESVCNAAAGPTGDNTGGGGLQHEGERREMLLLEHVGLVEVRRGKRCPSTAA